MHKLRQFAGREGKPIEPARVEVRLCKDRASSSIAAEGAAARGGIISACANAVDSRCLCRRADLAAPNNGSAMKWGRCFTSSNILAILPHDADGNRFSDPRTERATATVVKPCGADAGKQDLRC